MLWHHLIGIYNSFFKLTTWPNRHHLEPGPSGGHLIPTTHSLPSVNVALFHVFAALKAYVLPRVCTQCQTTLGLPVSFLSPALQQFKHVWQTVGCALPVWLWLTCSSEICFHLLKRLSNLSYLKEAGIAWRIRVNAVSVWPCGGLQNQAETFLSLSSWTQIYMQYIYIMYLSSTLGA